MRYIALIILLSFCTTQNETKSNEDSHLLQDLVQFYWDFQTKEYPMFATQAGIHHSNHTLGSYTMEDYQRRGIIYDSLLQILGSWDVASLSKEQLIEYALIKYQLEDHRGSIQHKGYLMPLLADAGFHISFAFLPLNTPFGNLQDYENYIARLNEFPQYVAQHIELLKEGLRLGISQPQIIFEGYEVTYESHIVEDPVTSRFYKPFTNLSIALDELELQQLETKAQHAVTEVSRGYQTFADFMQQEYIPQARTTIGVSELPNGSAYYQQRINHFTTLDITAEEIHKIGLEQVGVIKAEMLTIMEQVGFDGDLRAFMTELRTDEQFYAKEPQELLHYAAHLAKQADAALPKFFGKLPRQPYGVAPVPDHLAPKYTGGRYIPADIHSTSAGYYWVNTFDLKSRPFYVMPALTLHEAVPGHHLQMALSQELTGFSPFRQNLYISAFGEGWGLYSEYLGIEMGLYDDPYTHFGRLTYEMWRACRLVVDTGIHAFGWTRGQVLQYLTDHTALSLHEITTETDRYISWPGQALAYKMGEIKIKELRKRVADRLGEDFNLREFHDLILSQGTVTLPILENLVDEYIEDRI